MSYEFVAKESKIPQKSCIDVNLGVMNSAIGNIRAFNFCSTQRNRDVLLSEDPLPCVAVELTLMTGNRLTH